MSPEPAITPEIGKVLIEQRMARDPVTGCWNWTIAKQTRGYGELTYKGKHYTAHRLAAHSYLGMPLDSILCVLHKCDNTSCCNPDHLFLGTQADNVRDCLAKGRGRRGESQLQRTECPHGHPYSGPNLIVRNGGRRCRACKNANERRRRKSMRLQRMQKGVSYSRAK